MFGVLVDVSGSMKSAYAVDYSSSVAELNVEGTHAIFTTIMNIVKPKDVHHEQDSIFVSAFGLSERAETCDLISLLDYVASPNDSRDGYQQLFGLAEQHGAPQAKRWIKDHLSQREARILYNCLRSDARLIPQLIELIPSQLTTTVTTTGFTLLSYVPFVGKAPEEAVVRRSEAYQFAHKIIDNAIQSIQKPKPRPVQYVAEMLDDLVQSKASPESLHDQIQDVIEPIKPYIYGRTPMCQALADAEHVFRVDRASEFRADDETTAKSKVLFILSDGMATDGDPRPIAKRLQSMGITIATCFLTSGHIDNPKRLLDKVDPNWGTQSEDGRSVLFEMSSIMRNTDAPLFNLVVKDWVLPPSGVSRLFIQANSLDVINEFCKLSVSQMTKTVHHF